MAPARKSRRLSLVDVTSADGTRVQVTDEGHGRPILINHLQPGRLSTAPAAMALAS
jgi:hypothetical protein